MKNYFVLLIFFCGCLSGKAQRGPDTLKYSVLMAGRSHYQQAEPIFLTDAESFNNYYLKAFNSYPTDFHFDFDQNMIVVIYRHLTSGSDQLAVDYILEYADQISIMLVKPSKGIRTADMNPRYIIFAMKKTDKKIEIE